MFFLYLGFTFAQGCVSLCVILYDKATQGCYFRYSFRRVSKKKIFYKFSLQVEMLGV